MLCHFREVEHQRNPELYRCKLSIVLNYSICTLNDEMCDFALPVHI